MTRREIIISSIAETVFVERSYIDGLLSNLETSNAGIPIGILDEDIEDCQVEGMLQQFRSESPSILTWIISWQPENRLDA